MNDMEFVYVKMLTHRHHVEYVSFVVSVVDEVD